MAGHEHPGRWTSSSRRLGAAVGHHRPAFRRPAVAGFSVGWSDEEHQVMDVDPRTRGARCDELIDALLACWGPDPVAFEGRFFTIPRPDVSPSRYSIRDPGCCRACARRPGLRRTAEKFDIWNPASGALEQHLEMLATLPTCDPPGFHRSSCTAGCSRHRQSRLPTCGWRRWTSCAPMWRSPAMPAYRR